MVVAAYGQGIVQRLRVQNRETGAHGQQPWCLFEGINIALVDFSRQMMTVINGKEKRDAPQRAPRIGRMRGWL